MYLSAMGAIASSAAFCASLLAPSQSATTTAESFKAPGPSEMFATGLGYHGNSAPVGSEDNAARPSFVMTEPSLSMTTNEGMPRTPKRLLSCSFSFLQEYDNASHGCSAKYSWKASSSRSELTKTISIPLSFKLVLYHSANCGVK